MTSKRKSQRYYDSAGRRLLAEFSSDWLRITIMTARGHDRTIQLEVLTTRVSPFGLSEEEIAITTQTVAMYLGADESSDCLMGSCSIPGTFDQGWIDRIYFRLRLMAK